MITPAEVQTSVIRCRPSASSAMLLWRLATRSRTMATPKLMSEAIALRPSPRTGASSGSGRSSRGIAVTRMPAAASTISAPSMPAAKYSALEKP